MLFQTAQPPVYVFPLHLLRRPAALSVGAAHLLGASCLLAGLALDGALGLLDGALELVLQVRLAFVVGVGGALFGDAGAGHGFFGGGFARLGGGGFAFGDGLGGDGGEDSGAGVAGCAAGLGHGLSGVWSFGRGLLRRGVWFVLGGMGFGCACAG